MEILLILLGILIWIWASSGTLKPQSTQTCDQKKEPHKWVWRGEDGNNYMVCETCRSLPGGGFEEGRESDRK